MSGVRGHRENLRVTVEVHNPGSAIVVMSGKGINHVDILWGILVNDSIFLDGLRLLTWGEHRGSILEISKNFLSNLAL